MPRNSCCGSRQIQHEGRENTLFRTWLHFCLAVVVRIPPSNWSRCSGPAVWRFKVGLRRIREITAALSVCGLPVCLRSARLLAAALEVPDEVFREAFAGVSPSAYGPPSASGARANKDVLVKVLAHDGITDERLNEVSDCCRF